MRITAKQFAELLKNRGAGTARPGAAKPRKAQSRVNPGPPSVPAPPALESLLTGLAGASRCWTLLMPYGELLTSNQRLHHMAEHRIRRRLRSEAEQTARTRQLPRLERAAVHYVLHPRPINRKRDPGNWAPTAKAYVDGLVDAELLPDDNSGHLRGPYPEIGPPVSTGLARMSLVIIELIAPSELR